MKAISIWQPWASLIAVGAKRFETRSWPTRYRGPIAIHAARTWNAETAAACEDYFILAKLSSLHGEPLLKNRLPMGSIVAVGVLTECVPTEAVDFHRISMEYKFGNFMPGRFAWRIDLVERLVRPVSCTGRQGLWDTGVFLNEMVPLEQLVGELRSAGLLKKEGWS